jgi:hypothetical protein
VHFGDERGHGLLEVFVAVALQYGALGMLG